MSYIWHTINLFNAYDIISIIFRIWNNYWLLSSKGLLGTREEIAFPNARAELNKQQKPKSSVEGIWVPDVITTCLLFVRIALCKSCNIRIIRGMHAANRSAGGQKKRRGMKVPVDTRVLPCEGARTCGRNRGVVLGRVSECRGQSTDFSADIAEFQWTHWPRKPIAVHLPISLLSFFFTLMFWKAGRSGFLPNITRCCSLKRPSTSVW